MRLIIVISLLFCFTSSRNIIYGMEANSAKVNLAYHISYYTDSSNLSFKQIKKIPKSEFVNYTNQKLKMNQVYWLQLSLKQLPTIQNFNIYFNCVLSHIELYQEINDTLYKAVRSGLCTPYNERSTLNRNKDIVPLQITNNEQLVFYVKVHNQLSNNYSLSELIIVPNTINYEDIYKFNFIQGLFIGVLFILCLFNFFLFIFTKSKLYFLYTLYIFLNVLFFLYSFQFSDRYLFPESPKLDLFLFWSIFIAQYIYLLFFQEFLKTEYITKYNKPIKYISNFVAVFLMVLLVLHFINYKLSLDVCNYYTLFNVVLIIVSFIVFFKQFSITGKIILTGALVTVLGAFITIIFGFSENYVNQISYYQGGVFVEFLLFTFALNYTYNQTRIENLEALYENSLLQIDAKKKEKRNEKLQKEVDSKNRILATKVIMLSENENINTNLIKQLSLLDLKGQENSAIQQTIKTLKSSKANNTWSEFEKHFEEVNPQFYNVLSRKYPELSANERKICAYLKLNLSTKEIANVTGKSLNTIDVARSRLRKKMGLPKDANLQTLISKM